MRILFILLAGLLISITAKAQNKLPDITVKNLEGEKINLADFGENGKITVISFWATWCSPCKKELNNMAEMCLDWREMYDAEVVAISIDDARDAAKVRTYVDGQAWEYVILLDQNQDVKRALNVQTVPFTLLVDENGDIVYKHNGYVEGDEYILEDKIKELKEE